MTTTRTARATVRRAGLRKMLQDRRRETQGDVQGRLHDVRTGEPTTALDEREARHRQVAQRSGGPLLFAGMASR